MTECRDDDVDTGLPELDDDAPRSRFPSIWICVSLVLALLGAVAVFAAPYLRNWIAARPDSHAATSATASVDAKREAAPTPSASQPEPAKPTDSKALDSKRIEPSKAIEQPAAPRPEPTAPERAKVKTPKKREVVASAKPDAKAGVAKVDMKRPQKRALAKSETPAAPAAKNDALVRQRAQERVVAVRPSAHEGAPGDDAARKTGDAAADTRAGANAGDYWVQVAAVKGADAARRLATQLRAHSFRVDESVSASGVERDHSAPAPAVSSGEQYEVFVAGVSASELTPKLGGKGLAASTVPEGSIVTPRLPLPDAVALAKSLGAQGFRVQVKRKTAAVADQREPERRSANPGRPLPTDALYRIRVGTFTDRASADAAVRRLHGLGYERAFVARTGQ
jgi:outer membrane biosynthesis protein TonB